MGADKKTIIKKCGEILLSLKTNKKSKVYIFNCLFCDENCDQLKKFSLHLDQKHSQKLYGNDDEPEPVVSLVEDEEQLKEEGEEFQLKNNETITHSDNEDIKENLEVFIPEIKVEELMDIDITATLADDDDDDDDYEEKKHTGSTKVEEENEDPLETPIEMRESSNKAKSSMEVNVKNEKNENDSDDGGDAEDNTYELNYDFDYEDSVDESGSESEHSDKKVESLSLSEKLAKLRKRTPKKGREEPSDVSSDDSRDSDFEIDKEKIKTKVGRKKAKKPENSMNFDGKELTIAILAALEKQPVLWDIKDRSHDKIIRQNGFQEVAKEINEKLQIQIKWEDVRKRITDIRYEYSREYDKQLRGEKSELPWYTEHMQYLKENIEVLIKHRYQKKKYRRLNSLEESHIPIIIEYYKKCEILWQVNNIGFVVKPKKLEALKPIIQELKEQHNIDINIHDMQRRIDYINRIYSTDKEQQLKCEMESKEFVPSSKYYEQLGFLSDSQGPFKCLHCNEIIHKYETYHIHIAEHTNTVPFKCALCEMRFNKLVKYIVHAKRHLKINNYHCDVCGKGYPFRAELDWHVREHTGEEPYLCEICGASFRSRHGYDNHIRRHEKRFRYECHICKYGFNHLHALNAHVKAHLNIRDILCNVCGKGFTAKKHLLRHQQIHSDTKRYKCIVCGKAFAQDAGLRAHRKQHVEYTSLAEIAKKDGFRKGKYNYD